MMVLFAMAQSEPANILVQCASPYCIEHHDPGAPARDGRVAEYEEFLIAWNAGTIAAWDDFLARHPDSIYASKARAERGRLVDAHR